MKRVMAIVLAIAMIVSCMSENYMSVKAASKKPLKLSKKKVTINLAEKKTATVKIKVNKKYKKKFKWSGKVKWKITKGKKVISIKKKGKNKQKIKITAKKTGTAKVRAKYKNKKYVLKVKVVKQNAQEYIPPENIVTTKPEETKKEDTTTEIAGTETVTKEQPTQAPTQATTQAPTQATQAPTTTAEPTTTHVMKAAGVQEEAADSQVVTGVNLRNFIKEIDSTVTTTMGNKSNNEGIDKLFDGDRYTKYYADVFPTITIAWSMSRATVLKSYTLVTAGDSSSYKHRDPHTWKLFGSMDGEKWFTVDAVDNGGIDHQNNHPYTYTVDREVECQYYMFQIQNSGDDGALWLGSQLSELELNGDVTRISNNKGRDITGEVKQIVKNKTTLTGNGDNESIDKLFDQDKNTKMFSISGTPSDLVWEMNQESTIYSYTLSTANDNAQYHNRTIKSWDLYGSADGNNWEKIDTVTESGMADIDYADYTYLVDKVGTYKYYKMTITGKYGGSFQLSGISLQGISIPQSEFRALFVGDWTESREKYRKGLSDLFYNVYPRQYTRWAEGNAPKVITVVAQEMDGVAYTAGTSVCISDNWIDTTTGYGYFSHELTHVAQQYGNIDSSWWVENMANYGGFRYYHWAYPENVQIYSANDTSLQDWGYEAYGNNKWFFAYMDAKWPTTKDGSGTIHYGLIDSLNRLLKYNRDKRYNDNPTDTTSDWNKLVKQITGYDCIESLRLHYVDELKNGTWAFTGFGNYQDNWITENIPGLENLNYPMLQGKVHGNKTASKLGTAVTSGTNLIKGASVVSVSGEMNANEGVAKLVDGNLDTKWCTSQSNTESGLAGLTGGTYYATFDLGSEKTFNTYTLYNTRTKEGFNNMKEWEILVSNDGKNWTSADYQVNNNNDLASYDIGSVTARYVRIKVYDTDTLRLYELQLYNR